MRAAIVYLMALVVPTYFAASSAAAAPLGTPEELRAAAQAYYDWRDASDPVASSDAGKHTWDDRLKDVAPAAIEARRKHVDELLAQVRPMQTETWNRDDRIDWLLFRSQLETSEFFSRVQHFEDSDPQFYVNECSNAIFSLLKKEYAPPRTRAIAATARMRQMPELLEQGKKNLTHPVALYARLAIDAARSIDGLFTESLATLSKSLSGTEKRDHDAARDAAIHALHGYADWLEKQLPNQVEWSPMGHENYDYMLHHVYLLPLDAEQVEMLGAAELARYRGLESMLSDPKLANPDPARSPNVPKDQAAFLAAYESRQTEMIDFLRKKSLITLPGDLGKFEIRQLPEAFKPTSPGGFMNAPGLYDKDPTGFYFIPTYNPKSGNFYIRAAIEDPRPILGHEGIPGHFLQLSIANHLKDEIRRQHGDGVFIEGWALYGEEMLLRTGLYPENSPSHGQVLRLSRYRAARIGVDVNLHTGKWSMEQAVKYFMEAGGLDREAAEGEAAGAAANPSQKITYMVGKWQIMRLLGKYRDRMGADFQLGRFHDALIANGSLPLSVVEWILLDDRTALETATR
jgi:uncharacterized protein (DUF885 family)